jgi:hypothetical protein
VRNRTLWAFVVGGLVVAALFAFFVSPHASSQPDGLERVAIDQDFLDTATDHAMADAPLADYGVRGIDDPALSTGVAGLIGVASCFALGVGFVVVTRRRGAAGRRHQHDAESVSS